MGDFPNDRSEQNEGCFLLPNPMYGKWEGALYNNVYPDNAEDATKLRLENLIN